VNRPHLTPMYDIYSHLVYAVNGSDVVATIVNGRILMEDGVLMSLNVEDIMAAANRIADDIAT
jgi:5-methylthioadenosine/S-adenosylhomocysteine deaminase